MYRAERFENLHIEDYTDSAAEQCILALVKLYLNTVADAEQEVKTGLESQAGLEELLKNANANITLKDTYAETIKRMLSVFKGAFDAHAIAERYGVALRAFLLDCRKELRYTM